MFYKVWFGSDGQDGHSSLSSTAHDRNTFCIDPESLIFVMTLPIRFIGVYRALSRYKSQLKTRKVSMEGLSGWQQSGWEQGLLFD